MIQHLLLFPIKAVLWVIQNHDIPGTSQHYIWHPISNILYSLNCCYSSVVYKMVFPIDDFHFLFHRKKKFSAVNGASCVLPNLLYTTKSNLYLANFLPTVVSGPELYILLMFHMPNLMSVSLLVSYQRISPRPRLCEMCCNIASFYGGDLLANRPTPKLEDHPLPAVRNCSLSIFAATLHIRRPFLHL